MDGLGRTVARLATSTCLKTNLILPFLQAGIITEEDDFIYLDLLGIRCNGGLEQEAPLGCYQMIICLLSIIIRVLVATLASQSASQSVSQSG